MMKKKMISLIAVVVMVLSFAGCGADTSKDNAGTGSTKDTDDKGVDAESVIADALAKASAAKSADVTSAMDLNIEAGGQKTEMKMTMDASMFSDPLKAKIDTTLDMGEQGTQKTESYMVNEDGKFTIYIGSDLGDGTVQWVKQEMEEALFTQAMEQYNSNAYLNELKSSVDSLKMEEIEEDGKNLYKIDGVLTGDSMEKALDASGMMNQLGALTGGGDTSILKDLGDLKITAYIDKDTTTLTKISMDLSDLLTKLMENIAKEAGQDAGEISTKCTMDTEYKSYDSSADFELPEEAKNAQEMDVSSQIQ
jgi:predicted small lipoprotein YifL